MIRHTRDFTVCALALLVALPAAALAAQTPALVTDRFAFYSDFDTNLNDALIAAGVARNFSRPELFRAAADSSCFLGLPPSARAAWDGAVDYYAKVISPADAFDRQQYLLRIHLAGLETEWADSSARQFVGIASNFRAAAAPAYRACRWAAQDSINRQMVAQLAPLLARHERGVEARLEELYRKQWSAEPIRVDIVETVGWSGANSVAHKGRGHLLVSRTYQGPASLELVFHEASHLLMFRTDPVRQALDSAARAAGMPLPADLWHVVLFHTTGETVRRALRDAGVADYTPLLREIYTRSPWRQFESAVDREWTPYVRGERSLTEAARRLLEAIRGAGGSESR